MGLTYNLRACVGCAFLESLSDGYINTERILHRRGHLFPWNHRPIIAHSSPANVSINKSLLCEGCDTFPSCIR